MADDSTSPKAPAGDVPSVRARYEAWVRTHSAQARMVEQLCTAAATLVPSMLGEGSEQAGVLMGELGTALGSSLALYHSHVILAPEPPPESSSPESTSAFVRAARLALTAAAHGSVVAEAAAESSGGEDAKWAMIRLLETLKAVARLFVLRQHTVHRQRRARKASTGGDVQQQQQHTSHTSRAATGAGRWEGGSGVLIKGGQWMEPNTGAVADAGGIKGTAKAGASVSRTDVPASSSSSSDPGANAVATATATTAAAAASTTAHVAVHTPAPKSTAASVRELGQYSGRRSGRKLDMGALTPTSGSGGRDGADVGEGRSGGGDGGGQSQLPRINAATAPLVELLLSSSSSSSSRGEGGVSGDAASMDIRRVRAARAAQELGELLHVVRPVAYVWARSKWGSKSWVPWGLSLVLDLLSMANSTKAAAEVVSKAHARGELSDPSTGAAPTATLAQMQPALQELNARRSALMMYLMRAPLFDVFTKPLALRLCAACEGVPLLGMLMRLAVHSGLLYYQNLYFYCSASN